MKPTFQIKRAARHNESQRPSGHLVNHAPSTDWSFQSGADLRAGTAPSQMGSLYAVTHGLYDAHTKWEDRIEGFGLCVVIALAGWPVIQAIAAAIQTV